MWKRLGADVIVNGSGSGPVASVGASAPGWQPIAAVASMRSAPLTRSGAGCLRELLIVRGESLA